MGSATISRTVNPSMEMVLKQVVDYVSDFLPIVERFLSTFFDVVIGVRIEVGTLAVILLPSVLVVASTMVVFVRLH
jgi:hypothetical protein